AAGALPLALGGFMGALAITQFVPTTWRRIGSIAMFAVVAGFALTAVLRYMIGTFDGNYVMTSLGAVLGIAATAYAVLGLRSLLGTPGIGVASLLIVVVGNPLSGLASAPEMLPTPWGALGQLLPPGATGTLLRNLAYFDGHGSTHSLIVLGCWLLAGLALTTATLRHTGPVTRELQPEVPSPDTSEDHSDTAAIPTSSGFERHPTVPRERQ
ncbi:MAG: ABC transporter permease, partial [Rhodococcus sp. (in: high G+C Gram-positive bacteria)]|nr:ABC transporter permease [Rhodococcus sp. (in: high G+C Gram-positive bacteria)]